MAELLAADRGRAAGAADASIRTIPEAVNDIVMRCLQPKPEDRYPTTQDLVNALDHLTPDGHVRSDVHEVIITRRRPLWQVAAAALVIVALAGTAGWYVSDRTSDGIADALGAGARSDLGVDRRLRQQDRRSACSTAWSSRR